MAGASWPDPSRARSPTRMILDSWEAVTAVMDDMVGHERPRAHRPAVRT